MSNEEYKVLNVKTEKMMKRNNDNIFIPVVSNQAMKRRGASLMKRLVFSSILGGSALVPALAQNATVMSTVKVYTLSECLSEAMANNLDLRSAGNQIAMSAEQRKEAYTRFFPTLSASGGGFISNHGLLQMSMGDQKLSLAKNGVGVGIMAMQPVFAGGQIVNGNRLAKVGEAVSRLQRGLSENEIRLNVETYYWQAVMLKEKLRTLGQMDKQLVRVEADAKAAVDAGVRNRNDLLQVQLRKNETRTSRIQVENGLTAVCDMLAQVMGHAGETIGVSYAFDGNTPPESPQQYFLSPEAALTSTREYQLLDKQIEADRLNYKLSVGKNLPSVAVGGGYLYNNVMDKSQNNLIGMLTVSVPVSSWWGGSHDMKRQKIQLANAVINKQNKSEVLIIRMRKAWNDMNDAYKQVGIAKESIAQSEENLRLNTDYYRAGTATVSDLLDAQTLYQQSRDKYVEAFANYEVKKCEYLQATGR